MKKANQAHGIDLLAKANAASCRQTEPFGPACIAKRVCLGFGGAPSRMSKSYIKYSFLRFIHGLYSLI